MEEKKSLREMTWNGLQKGSVEEAGHQEIEKRYRRADDC